MIQLSSTSENSIVWGARDILDPHSTCKPPSASAIQALCGLE